MTLHELVADARGRLGRAGIRDSEAGLDAELLARVLLGWDRARFLAARHRDVPTGFRQAYDRLIARRERREPTSYIIGSKEFWGLDFEVSPNVLIPRPETEFLIEEALTCAGQLSSRVAEPLIIDVGTGSGCLAVVLARELHRARIVATDISWMALDVARRNATRHGVAGRIHFVQTSLLQGVAAQANLIVSNPPYVPKSLAPALSPEVRDFEPHVALFGGADGLEMQRTLLQQASTRLAAGGFLVMEFGDGQEAELRAAIASWPCLQLVRIREDLQGIPRTAVISAANGPGRNGSHHPNNA
jgi:release factor glutamine methyltransferase